MPTPYGTNPTKNTATYTPPARSDFVADSTAKFGVGKFSKARFGKDSDFTHYGKINKNTTTYGNINQS